MTTIAPFACGKPKTETLLNLMWRLWFSPVFRQLSQNTLEYGCPNSAQVLTSIIRQIRRHFGILLKNNASLLIDYVNATNPLTQLQNPINRFLGQQNDTSDSSSWMTNLGLPSLAYSVSSKEAVRASRFEPSRASDLVALEAGAFNYRACRRFNGHRRHYILRAVYATR